MSDTGTDSPVAGSQDRRCSDVSGYRSDWFESDPESRASSRASIPAYNTDMRRVVELWSSLPEEMREGILGTAVNACQVERAGVLRSQPAKARGMQPTIGIQPAVPSDAQTSLEDWNGAGARAALWLPLGQSRGTIERKKRDAFWMRGRRAQVGALAEPWRSFTRSSFHPVRNRLPSRVPLVSAEAVSCGSMSPNQKESTDGPPFRR